MKVPPYFHKDKFDVTLKVQAKFCTRIPLVTIFSFGQF